MTDISLRNKILFLFLSLIIVSSVTTISAVLLATNNSVEEQAQEKLAVGQRVFEQLLDIRAKQLFESAEVLTSDFGFKTAVLGKDRSTILSVLNNHGARIGADLMMLASLDGQLIASTDQASQQQGHFPFKALLPEAEEGGGLMRTVMLTGNAYQILMLPIKAPTIAAWTVVGFQINSQLAKQLKDLTTLDVTFKGIDQSKRTFEISTLSSEQGHEKFMNAGDDAWQYMTLNQQNYLALVTSLVNTEHYKVDAILRTSLDKAFAQFSSLKIQILTISSIALALSVIIGFIIARNISHPVNTLVSAAQRISSGDYSGDILDGQYKHNEIGKLASSLSLMQKGIAEREDKILHQVYHDTLTGLANRISAQQQIDELLKQTLSSTHSVALMHINIRHFKQVNDTFGYQVGDQLLVAFSQKLRALSDNQYQAVRLGADEFLLLLQGSTEADVITMVSSLSHQLIGRYHIGELDIPLSISSGVSIYPIHGNRTDQLLRRADIAMNEAKSQKQTVAFYQAGADEKHLKQIRLVNDLKTAIADDLLVMFYQPKLDLRVKKITQVEALIRWFHPELGFISPDEFIGLAEQSGLMPSLSRWVIRHVLKDAAEWKQQGLELAMAVNLSAYDLAYDDLPGYVHDLLVEHSLTPTSLILEVTESAMMENPEQALKVLNQFKADGITLAIDDYGTGYSSLSQLKSLPVDELKIDLSFVLKLDQDKADQAIVQSTIEMGHNLGLVIVAEGVENRASWQLLEGWGCDKLQGYYISKPQSATDFIQWFQHYDVLSEYPKSTHT